MNVMVQADAIRVAILNKCGGIWMDADNVIINGDFLKRFNNAELGMIIDKKTSCPFIGFIFASKYSIILKDWLKQIINRVKIFKKIIQNKQNTTKWIESWKNVDTWYYLVNGILNSLIKNNTDKNF